MSNPRCIIPSTPLSEGQRMDAREAHAIFCATTAPTTGPAPIAFLPKFTTAGAYLAYKRGCNAQNASTFRSSPPCVPGTIDNIVFNNLRSESFSPPYDSYGWSVEVSWTAVSGISSYTVIASGNGLTNYLSVLTGATSVTVYFNWVYPFGDVQFTVTGTLGKCTYTGSGNVAPCFLEGALVQMADGSTKPIETVAVGDLVLGAFGEINQVLALHRPLLGDNLMCRINEEHSTTNHHPHISVDKQFYCGNPGLVNTATYGRIHKVIDGSGAVVDRLLHGLRPDRIQPLRTGIQLKTVEGSRVVRVFEPYAMPPETQLYNLVVGGSHTYHVDGYAVTGWPREDDFDYDTWTPV